MENERELGPLAPLVGTWEGDEGVDVAYLHAQGKIGETRFRERTTFSRFGPVDNGEQCLYGLDYRTAAWRPDEDIPFHTEVGYWLWDAAAGQVMRCFMVPRGSTVLAGGTTTPDARTITMVATVGSETYGVLSNPYLAKAARTVRYECTVDIAEDSDSYSYDETTTIEHARCDGLLAHTDRNCLHRVSHDALR